MAITSTAYVLQDDALAAIVVATPHLVILSTGNGTGPNAIYAVGSNGVSATVDTLVGHTASNISADGYLCCYPNTAVADARLKVENKLGASYVTAQVLIPLETQTTLGDDETLEIDTTVYYARDDGWVVITDGTNWIIHGWPTGTEGIMLSSGAVEAADIDGNLCAYVESDILKVKNRTGASVTLSYCLVSNGETTVADDAFEELCDDVEAGILAGWQGNGAHHYLALGGADGSVTPIWTREVETTDVDGEMCVVDNSGVSCRNRLGSSEDFMFLSWAYRPDFYYYYTCSAYAAAKATDTISLVFTVDPAADHAHLERSLNGGDWLRLQTTATWVDTTDPAYDPLLDEVFSYDATFENAKTPYQEEGLAHGIYDYRVVMSYVSGEELFDFSSNYSDDKIYLDTPKIAAFVVQGTDGSGTITNRAIQTVSISNSGDDTGNVLGAVRQIKIWDTGIAAGDVSWIDFVSGRIYGYVVSAGDGLRTINCKVRHESGEESATATDTITINESAAPAIDQTERGILCYGASAANGWNFTGDKPNAVTATSEDTDYPIENVQQADLGVVWKSDGYGSYSDAAGIRTWTATINYDLGTSQYVDWIGIAGHNLEQMYNTADAFGHSDGFHIYLEWYTGGMWATVDLAEHRGRSLILHRPEVSVQLVRLKLQFHHAVGVVIPASDDTADHWEIGRLILVGRTQVWEPAFNFDRQFTTDWTDPSVVAESIDGVRRVVDREMYEGIEVKYSDMIPGDWKALQEIYKRQGVRRPVLFVADPANVCTGSTAPASTDDEPTAIYGFFSDTKLPVKRGVNDYGDVTVKITEARG